MSRYGRVRLLLATAIVVLTGSVWVAARLQAKADTDSSRALEAGQKMLIAMLDQETGLRGYLLTRDRGFLAPYRAGQAAFERSLAIARHDARDGNDQALIARQVAAARTWQALAKGALARPEAARSVTAARSRKAEMDRFRAANRRFLGDKQQDHEREQSGADRRAVAFVFALCVFFALLAWLLGERPARRAALRQRQMAEFSDALQAARTEREGFDVLRRHLERWIESARAVVMIRNASANRLQAATALDQTPVLASKLDGAAPEACLAVRLAKPYRRREGEESLLTCELCGALPASSSCLPAIVGGEVIGSVLVQSPKPVEDERSAELQASVAVAGPVIANLRNLAIAELRAATDVLTGLPNHRAIQATLNRMVAQAGRSKTPLCAILFDLDHFKKVNDIHGHAKGDEVLAAVGQAVAATVRESDFVGRYGGEEFTALLPDTARDGGVLVAEKLRRAVESVEVPGLSQRLSASFGVAVLPDDAVTGEALLRAADRALYAAKNAGRNRVEVVRAAAADGGPAADDL